MTLHNIPTDYYIQDQVQNRKSYFYYTLAHVQDRFILQVMNNLLHWGFTRRRCLEFSYICCGNHSLYCASTSYEKKSFSLFDFIPLQFSADCKLQSQVKGRVFKHTRNLPVCLFQCCWMLDFYSLSTHFMYNGDFLVVLCNN